MPEHEWFGPLDKLSWQIGQITLLFDVLLAFGVCLLAVALAALVIQLIGLRQLMHAEKAHSSAAPHAALPVTEKSQPNLFRQPTLRVTQSAAVRRKLL